MVFAVGDERTVMSSVIKAALAFAPSEEPVSATVIIPKFNLRLISDLGPLMEDETPSTCLDVADFSGLSDSPLFIGSARQKVVINLSETGFVEADSKSAPPATEAADSPPEEVFMFDQPFAIVIKDNTSGLPLFVGWIADPTA